MHFTIGELISRLTSDYIPVKVTSSDGFMRSSLINSRERLVSMITSNPHWSYICDVNIVHYSKLRKLPSDEYLIAMYKMVPEATFKLLCRLYAVETLILSYKDTSEFKVVYECD